MNALNQNNALVRACTLACDYRRSVDQQTVKPLAIATALREAFDIGLPDAGVHPTKVIDTLVQAAAPGLMKNTDAHFFGWVMGASSEVGVAADVLTSIWGQNAGIYQAAPSAAIAEEVAAKWLLELLDLPSESTVGFTTGATMASFIGLAAARYEVLRRANWLIHQDGLIGAPRVHVLVSEQAHASVLAVLQYLGFGQRNLTVISTDSQGRMRTDELQQTVETIRFDEPMIVVAQAGHINSGAFDHFNEIADLIKEHNAWFHIDGAFGLWARASSRYHELSAGAERADSWAVDGHKWLQVPYDCGYAIVRNGDAHRHAMSISASYLNREESDGRNPSDYGPELSRRARGFTTWAVLQALGRNGIKDMVDRHCDCAAMLAEKLQPCPGIRVLNDVCLNQVAITFDDSSDKHYSDAPLNSNTTEAVIQFMQQQNRCFVSGANWQGYRIMRVSVIAEGTSEVHINKLVADIVAAWRDVSMQSEYSVADQQQKIKMIA